jgi:small subunit ribosomal protein S19
MEGLVKKNKDKFYRGINVEELKNLEIREFSKLVRTIQRNYDVINSFIKRCNNKSLKNRPIKTHDRSLIVVPQMIGKIIGVYNGKEFIRVEIIPEMMGHRLGEFSPTRRPTKHGSAGVGATKSSASRSVK